MSARLHERGEKDLFDQFQTADKKIRKKTSFLPPRLKNNITFSYENIIFIVIGFIMSCIIFFSLGVEKGRQDIGRIEEGEQRTEDRGQRPKGVPSRVEGRREDSDRRESRAKSREGQKREVKSDQEADRLETTGQAIRDTYKIQLAAFSKVESAEQEAEKLRREGYEINMKKSGSYYQLYIGGFQKRKTAEQIMERLKEKYRDCYIIKE